MVNFDFGSDMMVNMKKSLGFLGFHIFGNFVIVIWESFAFDFEMRNERECKKKNDRRGKKKTLMWLLIRSLKESGGNG